MQLSQMTVCLFLMSLTMMLTATGGKEGGSPSKPTSEPQDWLQSFVRSSRNFTAEELKYSIKLGMSASPKCDDIGEHLELTLVVANTTYDVCQGWIHYVGPYPDKSTPHDNSAVKVTCIDGGITYTQTAFSLTCGYKKNYTWDKREYTSGCHPGIPPPVHTVIKDFSGCEAQGFKPSVDGKAPEVIVV
eukprot:gnl/MRDRNA2_/MRDRNA2_32785_c0_seq2.p1 gnl/MRDRNA2_/MRDRNA2_32785_c0~~gnl/MRDRNA2_/MRDRNA2_32785_c0_seq2.p1  ORF type:complete len:188 (-),score=21.02 gnl/MRDRNA2_/MRDRNA2_32785_c0_seq2:95-658(-)